MTLIDPPQSNRANERNGRHASGALAWRPGKPLSGVIPPLISPLCGQNQIDVAGLERLIEHIVRGGVHGVFLLGTTGEAVSLSPTARRQLIDLAIRFVDRRIPVLVGITDNCVHGSIVMARYAAAAGADAVVLTTPFYLPLEQNELTTYVRTIGRQAELPVFLYNMPRLTKTWFEVDTVRRLLDDKNIVGLKDSSADLSYLATIRAASRDRQDWSILVGSEALLVEAIGLGAHGCVGGGANVWPELLVELCRAAHAQDAERVNVLLRKLEELHAILAYGEYGANAVRGLKCALELLGICSGQMAEPFAPCDSSQHQEVARILQASGFKASLEPLRSALPPIGAAIDVSAISPP